MQRVRAPCPQAVGALLVLADEQQSFPRTVAFVRVAAAGTGLAGIVRIHLDR